MKILYVSNRNPLMRIPLALAREAHEVTTFFWDDYQLRNPLLKKIQHRAAWGKNVNRMNHDLVKAAKDYRPEVLIADKVLWMQPESLRSIQALGIKSISYMIDNYFGPRRDPGFRLYPKSIPFYDLHLVQRDANIPQYLAMGAKDVLKIQTSYEPSFHFPPTVELSEAEKDRNISFIGNPYDDRAELLSWLGLKAGLPVVISGSHVWKRKMESEAFSKLFREGELLREKYREGIWRSKVNLSFVTKSNCDEFAEKSFEITACGGFLLAERSVGHQERFKEDVEAVFFDGREELAEKASFYLRNPDLRLKIAAAGHARCMSSGYDLDSQIRKALLRVFNRH